MIRHLGKREPLSEPGIGGRCGVWHSKGCRYSAPPGRFDYKGLTVLQSPRVFGRFLGRKGSQSHAPQDWSVLRVYFAITIIISLIGWTRLAREVRGRFLALREEDFVVAARLYGTGPLRIIFRHMVPSFVSHIIATTTLAIPAIIIAETALSFLGLGMRQPAISWGVLLKEGQNVQSVALAPWVLVPGLLVIVSILAFNFLGDGLRDAADPYSVQGER